MSDILQRTIASLPGLLTGVTGGGGHGSGSGGGPHGGPRGGRGGPLDVSNGMINFVQSMCNIKSKYAEEQLVKRELSLQKQKLSNPAQTTAQKRDSLVRLLYCHLLGYDVSFAYIQAVKLAQLGTILEKRVGYLLCAAFLDDTHELSMLLINTILKDLSSTNILEVCVALVAAGHLVSSEMIPSVLPSVSEKLKHSKEIIRRKAVLCLRAFFLKAPALASQLKPSLSAAIGDKDPGVMWAVLETLRDLVQNDESSYVDLVPTLVDILEQVISRKLPSQFDYHTVPSPWLTITILKLFAALGKIEESARKQISPILQDVLQRTEPSHNAGLAIIYEALVTIAVINADSYLMSLAAKCVSRFLSSKKINLRYIGIKVLSAIVQTDDRYALDHQAAVIDCLEHQDVTIQKTTLHLLCNMANPVNKQVICNQLLDYAGRTTDHFSRVDIVSKILDIADRLSDDVLWYIDQVMRLLETNGDVVPVGTVNRLVQIIKSGCPSNEKLVNRNQHEHALKICWQKLKCETLSEPLLKVAVWTVGEYCHLDSDLTPQDVSSCLVDWYRRCSRTETRKWILSALCKQRHLIRQPKEILETLQSVSDPNDRLLQQRLHEFETLCMISPEIQETLSFRNLNTQMDFSLSFLDDFVSEALESGSLPYRTASLRLSQAVPLKPKDIPSVVSDLIVDSSEESLSSLLLDAAGAKSRDSSETSSTGKREALGLQMKGVKVVWSKDGLVQQTAKQTHTSETETETLSLDNAKDAQKTVTPDEIRKAEERKALAKALFSGINVTIKEEQSSDKTALNNSDLNGEDVAKTHLKERSISPDSIDMELHTNRFCDENLTSDASTEDFLFSNSVEHKDGLANDRPFLSLTSRDLALQNTDDLAAEDDSLTRLHIENRTPSNSLGNSLKCHLQLQSDHAELFCSSSVKPISCDNLVESHSAASNVGQTGSELSKIPKDLSDCNSRTDDDVVRTKISDAEIHSKTDVLMPLKQTEITRTDETLAISKDRSAFSVGRCFSVFDCDELSVFCQKCYFKNFLQLTVMMFPKKDTVGNNFTNATISVVDLSCQIYKAKFITDEAPVDEILLSRLSCEDGCVKVHLNIQPSSMESICHVKQFSVDLLLHLPRLECKENISIPVHLTDFIRPFECSLQEFAELWVLLPQELHRISSVTSSVMEHVTHLLVNRCQLHVVKISGDECLLAGQILDSERFKILLHVKLVDSQTGVLLYLWMKLQDRSVLDDLMSTIITALSD